VKVNYFGLDEVLPSHSWNRLIVFRCENGRGQVWSDTW
jgi:hypothetical protein